MKLTYPQLEAQLTKNISPIYLVSGDEIILKQEAINLIRKAARTFGFTERVRILLNTNLDEENLYTQLYATPMFSEKQLIELDCRHQSPNKTIGSILENYANNPCAQNVLLIDMDKVDSKITKSSWYMALEKKGSTMTFWPLPFDQLPRFIIDRAKKYKMQMDLPCANLLANYVEGNLLAAVTAIEKLYLLQLEKIDAEVIKTILADESRFNVFDFVEHLLSADKAKALHSLAVLKTEHIEPSIILWAITRELRILADLKNQLQQGASFDALCQKQRIFFGRQKAMRIFLNKFSQEECYQFLKKAGEIDPMIKGANPHHAWDALEIFCLRIAV